MKKFEVLQELPQCDTETEEIYIPHLYSLIYQWTLQLLPYLGHCK